jgi:hypothetical protein
MYKVVMGWICSTHCPCQMITTFLTIPQSKRALWKSGHNWEDNIKAELLLILTYLLACLLTYLLTHSIVQDIT